MAGDRRAVQVDILGDASNYKKAMADAEGQTGKTGGIMSGIFAGVGIAATNLAVEGIGKVIDFLGDSSKVAMDAEVTTTRLTTALQDNVVGFTGTADAMEGTIDAGRALGFTGDDLRASLSALVTVTKSTTQAQADQSIAEDLARARGIDLATATNIVIKAQEGNVGALKKLGIIVPAVTTNVDALRASHTKFTPEQLKAAQALDKAATATAALAAIQTSAKGQADAYAGTMAGSMAVAGTLVEGIQEKLGATLNQLAATILPPLIKGLEVLAGWFGGVIKSIQPLVPVVAALVSQYLAKLGDAFNQIVAAIGPLLPVLQKLAGEYIGFLVSELKVVAGFITGTVVPVIVNVAKAVIPVLTAALSWLATDVIPSVSAAFSYIASKVMPLVVSAIDWVSKNVLPALSVAFSWIVKNVLPPVVAALGWVANNVLPALGQAFGFITDRVIPGISGALQGLAATVSSVMGVVASVVKGTFNTVIGLVNGIIRAIDSISVHVSIPNPFGGTLASVDWNGAGISQIPYLHSGGTVPGQPGSDVLAVLQAGERVLPRGGSGGAAEVHIHIDQGAYIDGPSIDRLALLIGQRLSLAGIG
jgi:phage-related protein